MQVDMLEIQVFDYNKLKANKFMDIEYMAVKI